MPTANQASAKHNITLSEAESTKAFNAPAGSAGPRESANLKSVPPVQTGGVPGIAPPVESVSTGTAATEAAASLNSSLTTPALTTNGIATSAASLAQAQNSLELQNTPASLETNQLAMFDNVNSDRMPTALTPVSQHFYRVTVTPANRQRGFGGGGAGSATPLLASFQVEQSGQEIRVVDADGSVYTGTWQLATTDNARQAAAPQAAESPAPAAASDGVVRMAPSPKAEAQPRIVPQYSFRVSGTNRNLKQNIVFSGNFIPLTNRPSTPAVSGAIAGAAEKGRESSETTTPPLLLNSRIAGKVVIGGEREIEVNAAPAR
jgi:hypothetical protein